MFAQTLVQGGLECSYLVRVICESLFGCVEELLVLGEFLGSPVGEGGPAFGEVVGIVRWRVERADLVTGVVKF